MQKAMSKKILIVDDNEFIVEIMTYILNNKGYDVIALYDGNNVIQQIKTDNPDLVILDMMLPGADGRDICKAIKTDDEIKNLPVIMCTGSDNIDFNMKQHGSPNDVLCKPFDIDALANMVAYQLAA
jgi:DNA-binding response OmpR family regulator